MEIDIQQVKIEIYVPEEFVTKLRDALTVIGACRVGNYDHVVSYMEIKGYWKPLANSNPYQGEIGEISFGAEVKMEVRCPIESVQSAVRIIRDIHPYEEPVINIFPLLNSLFGVH